MPTYRIPASLFIDAENIHAAIQSATLYLDEASVALPNWGNITAVDIEVHEAEECPLTPED
jgi:hypothetical protein